MNINSLPMYAKSFYNNVSEIPKVFPESYYAAEGINNSFDTLLSNETSNKNIINNVLKKMSFGSHVSWVTAYLLTAAGYKTSGLGELRR